MNKLVYCLLTLEPHKWRLVGKVYRCKNCDQRDVG